MKIRNLDLLKNRTHLLLLLTLFTIILLTILSPYFLTQYNIQQMLKFCSVLILISIGQGLVILGGGGGIDLSVGSIISLSGIVMGLVYKGGMPMEIAIALTVLFGIVTGSINGFIVTYMGIPPLITTLGTMYTYDGLALILAKKSTISGYPESFGFLGQGEIFLVPAQFLLIVLPVFIITSFILAKSHIGRNLYLIGINHTAAKHAGIPVKKYRFMLYVISGFLASFGGIIMASWLMTSKADVGRNLELQAITVAMLGGFHIFGGVGKVGGIILAALIITMIASGLQLAQINTTWQLAVLGIILITMVFSNQRLNNIKR